MKFSPKQSDDAGVTGGAYSRVAHSVDRAMRLHRAVGVVCPGCGARIGKPCVSTVRSFGVGMIGTPIEGVHSERIAAAHEQGIA